MEKLKEGTEQTFMLLVCPYCKNEEYVPDITGPSEFECLHVSCSGTIRAWKCQNCQKNFYTRKD